jgi:tetratricopeptide (TPR) repeat protein
MHGDKWAAEGLGYIWYYGRTGVTDYEKAFRYYSKAAENGNFRSKIKVADMYKNGYYVEKDYPKYVEIIEQAKKEVEHTGSLGDPYSEIYTRLAAIRKEQGRYEEAADLYLDARDFLAQRIRYTGFFGDFNVMKWATEDLYTVMAFDVDDFSFYDLYYVFRKPCTVSFRYQGKKYTVTAADTENGIAVHFGDQRFRDVDAFFAGAKIGTEMLYVIYDRLYDFEVIS